MKQDMNNYTKEDQKVWSTLFERQWNSLQDKACKEYLDCLYQMKDVLKPHKIPNFNEINEWFQDKTGWEIAVVPGMIPVDDFFELLSNKKFCSSTWLRSWKELDYLSEPDMFHDIFGHIPLLAHPVFSDFVFEFAQLGKAAIGNEKQLIQLQRLYWFTIEFGLIREKNELKIYGAGILSSYGESISSISEKMQHHDFQMDKILNKHFINNEPQTEYFVVTDLDELFSSILKLKSQKNELAFTK